MIAKKVRREEKVCLEEDALGDTDFVELESCDSSILHLPCSSQSADQIEVDELQPPPEKKRKRSSTEKRYNPFGTTGGVYFDQREDGKLVPRVILPRILKTDVRRKYAQMFANVYNSCDRNLITQYMNTFYRNDFFFQQHCPGAMSPSIQHFVQHIVNIGVHTLRSRGAGGDSSAGLQLCREFWKEKVSTSYDLFFELLATRIKARSDRTAVVEFKFRLSGSFIAPAHDFLQLVPRTGIQEVGRMLRGASNGASSGGEMVESFWANYRNDRTSSGPITSPWAASLATNGAGMITTSDLSHHDLGVCLPDSLRGVAKLIKYDFLGIASMHLDSDNRIFFMSFQASG